MAAAPGPADKAAGREGASFQETALLGLGYLHAYHNYSNLGYYTATDEAYENGNGRIYGRFFRKTTTALSRFRRNGH